jgi:hypothetical protein
MSEQSEPVADPTAPQAPAEDAASEESEPYVPVTEPEDDGFYGGLKSEGDDGSP